MKEFWITSDLFDNEVIINFSYDPFKIINLFVHYLDLNELEEFYNGVSTEDYSYDYENEFVKFEKMGVFSDITIVFPNEMKTEKVDTDVVVASVGQYIEEVKRIQAERNPSIK